MLLSGITTSYRKVRYIVFLFFFFDILSRAVVVLMA